MRTLSQAQARRIALAAQGFGRERPADPGTRALTGVLDRLAVIQIDSVNVLTRSHYLPFFSRLGPYDTALLDRLRDGSGVRGGARAGRRMVEYWAHEASLIPIQTWPLLGFRMQRPRVLAWRADLEQQHAGLVSAVAEVVAQHGPLTAREVEVHLPHGAGRGNADWGWNWSAVKTSLECLFESGEVTSAGRTAQFERLYAAPARVLPEEVLRHAPGRPGAPGELESVVDLLRISLRAHGLGSARCLADYFRVRGPLVERGLERLEATGEAERVRVRGWDRPVWLDPEARRPRRVEGAALLSPFDSLVWQRERVEQLWDFRYRLEIYVPAPKRTYGYYVLPFLVDEQLVGRVDLKADREAGTLVARAIHWEDGVEVAGVAPRLLAELEEMAGWLGLRRVDLPVA
ncbi:winged helix-turn-helix domain-containing protein [Serinicoccus kebangsaanensis]|uniref:winged helix-turn-helix domain-containing protein n=1 Tax=Serinicoccus kebangsaanensis TaxID=2602069 RepID=UPI00124F6CC0|nr:crosslink repair DNA glycosylase YcaQ family protein [Serinicoccus kebangsaanensis]